MKEALRSIAARIVARSIVRSVLSRESVAGSQEQEGATSGGIVDPEGTFVVEERFPLEGSGTSSRSIYEDPGRGRSSAGSSYMERRGWRGRGRRGGVGTTTSITIMMNVGPRGGIIMVLLSHTRTKPCSPGLGKIKIVICVYVSSRPCTYAV